MTIFDSSTPVQVDAALVHYLETDLGLNLAGVDLVSVIDHLDKTSCHFESFTQFASAVASSIAVHETYFLRHTDQFTWLETVWLPAILKIASPVVHILSAGCSTGEEPYSLYAHLQPLIAASGRELKVDAVDVCANALQIAKAGRYGLWSLRGVNVEHEQSWLEVCARSVKVQPWVKDNVHFACHNLTHPIASHRAYDLILCRNVMIYMHDLAVGQTLRGLHAVLKPGGCILPGPSDPNPPEGCGLSALWASDCRIFVGDNTNLFGEVNPHVIPYPPAASIVPTSQNLLSAPAVVPVSDYSTIDMLIRNGHYQPARNLLEARLSKDELDTRAHLMLALLAMDLDDIATATVAARRASFLEPDAAFTIYVMSNVKRRNGDIDGSRAELAFALEKLADLDHFYPVKYCEEITVEQLKGVIHARLS